MLLCRKRRCLFLHFVFFSSSLSAVNHEGHEVGEKFLYSASERFPGYGLVHQVAIFLVIGVPGCGPPFTSDVIGNRSQLA